MKRFVSGALFLGFCFLHSNAAMAALSEADCRRYADEAMKAMTWNQWHCGFKGPRWAGTWQNHFGWCMGQGDNNAVYSEWSQRNQQIEDCKNVENNCLAYSNTAISQQWTNLNACSGHVCTGPRWTYDRAAHEGWCLRVSPADRRGETEARARQMCGC